MIRPSARLILCAAFLVLTMLPRIHAADEAPKVRTNDDCFTSRDVPITVETFAPDGDGKYPAIVFLHAIDGLETGHGPLYRRLARDFAGRGYVVLLVHYFDGTGPAEEDTKAYRKLFLNFLNQPADAPQLKACRKLFAAWVDVACDAVGFARQLPEVDGERIGLVGFSMGAFVGLAAAGREKTEVAAVVEFFGGLPTDVTVGLKKLPPTLIVHGDKDQTVSVKEAYALHGWMKAKGLNSEIAVYHTDHMFMVNESKVDLFTALSAQARASDFLQKSLARK